MSKLLLIMGDLAAGKTTFANKLAKRYDVVTFNKDGLKELAANNFSYESKEESRKLSILAVEMMLEILKQFCKAKKPLILEANFHQDETIKIHKIAKEYGYDVLTLLVQADIKILHKRFLNRAENENRHPVHLSAMFNEFESFKNYIEISRNENPLGKVLKIDATSFNYQDDKSILSSIDEFMKN